MAIRFLSLLFFLLTPLAVYASPAERSAEIVQILAEAKYHDVSPECVRAVLEAEAKASRPFSPGEIVWSAQTYMESIGETLPRRRCFTCRMEVLTPDGYKRIDQLRAGDDVMSWDTERKVLVVNHVLQIHRGENVAFGELIDHGSSEKPFEVTPDHPFYLPRLKTAYPLSDIAPEEPLLKFKVDAATCATSLAPKGHFVFRGTDFVFTLTLEGQPDNFIVNGVLVKNKPWPTI